MNHGLTKLVVHLKSGKTATLDYHGNQQAAEAWATAFGHWAGTSGAYDGHPVLDVGLAEDGGRFVIPFASIESMEVC